MADRAAIVTGGSGGIGFAIARMLGQEGHSLTIAARRPEKLEAAVQRLRGEGIEVESVAGNMAAEDDVCAVAERHRERFGRLDVLVNNAGVGIGGPIAEHPTKHLDLELGVNLRAVYILTRECLPLLKEAGAEHRGALVVNLSSIAGKYGQAGLAAYSATKAGVVGLTQALHREHAGDGIKATALCPGFVATDMTEWIQGEVPPDEMIQTEDVAGAVRYLLTLTPGCVIPEIPFVRPADAM